MKQPTKFHWVLSILAFLSKHAQPAVHDKEPIDVTHLLDGLTNCDLQIQHEDRHAYVWPMPIVPVRIVHMPVNSSIHPDSYEFSSHKRNSVPIIDSSRVRVSPTVSIASRHR